MSSLYLPRSKAMVAAALAVALSFAVFYWLPAEDWAAGVLLSAILSWASLIDLDRQILPNVLTVGLLTTGLLVGWADGEPPLLDRALGAVVGYGSLVALAYAYRQVRHQDGIGRGDAKLFAAGGAWLGWEPLPLVMLVASLLAVLYLLGRVAMMRQRVGSNHPISFGPFIALGVWFVWVGSAASWS